MITETVNTGDASTHLDLEPLLTVQDLERVLRVDKRTVRRLWKRGQLPYPLKVGGSNRWRADDIAQALDVLGRGVPRNVREGTDPV